MKNKLRSKKQFLSSIAILLIVSSVLVASASEVIAPATVVDQSCRQNRKDPFDRGWRFTEKSKMFGGKCYESSAQRAVEILSDSATSLEFANFYHQGQFWKARWEKSDRPTVEFEIVHFEAGVPLLRAGHTEMRFRFERGLELESQVGGKNTRVHSVVVSWQAGYSVGAGFNLLRAVNPNFVFIGRVVSQSSRIPENRISPTMIRPTEIYALKLAPKKAAILFFNLLRTSHQKAYKDFYKSLSNNCTTEPFKAIDQVLKESSDPRINGVAPFKIHHIFDAIIGPSHRALIQRNLISADQKPILLGDEWGLRSGLEADLKEEQENKSKQE